MAAPPVDAQAAPAADAGGRSACAAKAGRTHMQNGSGRVYLTAGAVYACPRAARTPYLVGPQWRVYDGAGRALGQPADPQARDFVLCAGGQLAFIGGYRSETPSGAPAEYEVRVSMGRHTVLLDAGPDVQPGSLRAGSGRLSWMNAGSPRQTATTCVRPTRSVAVPRMTVDQLFGD